MEPIVSFLLFLQSMSIALRKKISLKFKIFLKKIWNLLFVHWKGIGRCLKIARCIIGQGYDTVDVSNFSKFLINLFYKICACNVTERFEIFNNFTKKTKLKTSLGEHTLLLRHMDFCLVKLGKSYMRQDPPPAVTFRESPLYGHNSTTSLLSAVLINFLLLSCAFVSKDIKSYFACGQNVQKERDWNKKKRRIKNVLNHLVFSERRVDMLWNHYAHS